jgi:hypothetical protein
MLSESDERPSFEHIPAYSSAAQPVLVADTAGIAPESTPAACHFASSLPADWAAQVFLVLVHDRSVRAVVR